jgi:tetratricopeptide (TPR) repeat protein
VVAFAAFTLSHAYTAKGDIEQAVAYGELAVERAPTPGDKLWSQSFLSWALCRAGQAKRAVDFLAQSVAMQRAARFVWSEVCALWLGEGYWRLGDHARARQTLEELKDSARRSGMQFLLGSTQRLLAEVTAREDPLSAAASFDSSIELLTGIDAKNELALALAGRGRLHRDQGEFDKARASLERARSIFERLGTPGEPARMAQELAALPPS